MESNREKDVILTVWSQILTTRFYYIRSHTCLWIGRWCSIRSILFEIDPFCSYMGDTGNVSWGGRFLTSVSGIPNSERLSDQLRRPFNSYHATPCHSLYFILAKMNLIFLFSIQRPIYAKKKLEEMAGEVFIRERDQYIAYSIQFVVAHAKMSPFLIRWWLHRQSLSLLVRDTFVVLIITFETDFEWRRWNSKIVNFFAQV